jgi:hypothetical protein
MPLPSVYDDMPQVIKDYIKDREELDIPVTLPPFQKQSDTEGALLAIMDMDFISDEFALRQQQMMGEIISQPANDNLVFFFNALQYLLGENELLHLRGKAIKLRPFTRLDGMLQAAAADFQKLEQQYAAELFQVAQRLRQLRGRSQQQQMLDADIQREIVAYQKDELRLRKQLRDVRRQLRQEMDAVGRKLALLNMFGMPLLTMVFAFVYFSVRRRRIRVGR